MTVVRNALPSESVGDDATVLPSWVILHIPHDSTEVPISVRDQFVLDDSELAAEIERMTDHHTRSLFADQVREEQVVRAPVSRLVVDVERFPLDSAEPMAAKGMGAVYSVTSELKALRRVLSLDEREALMQAHYLPHHAALEVAVTAALVQHGRCLVIDCHSFPSRPLPYEQVNSLAVRPDICIGTDDFHTSAKLTRSFVAEFWRVGWRVKANDPFAGALVPSSRYRRDRQVSAIMVEINRGLYLCEQGAQQLSHFNAVARQVRQCCIAAINAWGSLE